MWFKIQTVLTLAAGTIFIMWIGEQISDRGIGNGISVVIFSGIVAGFPAAVMEYTYQLFKANQVGLVADSWEWSVLMLACDLRDHLFRTSAAYAFQFNTQSELSEEKCFKVKAPTCL
jgi:preprotein translocase subunit SecY